MTAYNLQNCDDFATSHHAAGENTRRAWVMAAERGLTGTAAKHFTQGYIHAGQGRTDLLGQSEDYDAGHAARHDPHHTEVFHISRHDGWAIGTFDVDGNQIGECCYEFRKPDAIKVAKQAGLPVHVFSRADGELQRVIK